jgi:alpha-beta hydrolase superfamily lysophospholipase
MSFFQSRDGTQLHERVWPAEGPAYAVLVIAHGYGEHIGRYDQTARDLAKTGLTVRGIDLRGHGQSGGVRGYCNRFGEYLDDVEGEVTRARGDGLPVFLLGHSFGGLVGAFYALKFAATIEGLVLTSPFYKLALPVPPPKLWAAKLFSRVYPKLSLPSGLRGADVSRDPEVQKAYDADPLNNKNATARWATEAMAAQEALVAEAPQLKLPVLLIAGEADRVAAAPQARVVFDRFGSTDKTIHMLAGQYHEVLNEPPADRQRTIAEIAEWLRAHVQPQTSQGPRPESRGADGKLRAG